MFNQYPYFNIEDLNLDYLMARMRNLERIVKNFVALESVTFSDPIQWSIASQYAKNVVVLDENGNAFLSKKAVPVGVGLDNEDYWLEIFNFMDYVKSFNSNLTFNIEANTDRASVAYSVDDWLLLDDVLYKVTAAIAQDEIFVVGTNIVHFTVEDFIKAWINYANGLIVQYKNDIDASELLYRQQLAGDIASTTASLQAQLDAAIAGATVDSEVINARVGVNNESYPTLKDAINSQITQLYNCSEILLGNTINVVPNDLNGYFDGDGSFISHGSFKSCKILATNIKRITYNVGTATGLYAIVFFDASDTVISNKQMAPAGNTTVIVPNNTKFIALNYFGATYITAGYNLIGDDIFSEISDDMKPANIIWYNNTWKLFDRSSTLNSSKNYFNDVITYTINDPWTGAPVFNLMGATTTPVTFDSEFSNHIYFDIGYTTNAASLHFKVVDTNNTVRINETVATGSGTIKVDCATPDIKYIYFDDTNTSDAGKTLSITHLLIYQADSAKTDVNLYDDKEIWLNDFKLKERDAAFNKKLLTVGDSLTTTRGGGDANGYHWQDILMQNFGFNTYDYGGGAGLCVANVGADSIYNKVMALTTDANVQFITFWGGTNDWASDVVLGNFDTEKYSGTRDNTTFYGGLFDCIEKILTLYPETPIMMITPPQRITDYAQGHNSNNTANNNGNFLIDFADAIIKVAGYYGIPVLDFYRTLGINIYNMTHYLYSQTSGGVTYYLHFNNKGEVLVADKISNFIRSEY